MTYKDLKKGKFLSVSVKISYLWWFVKLSFMLLKNYIPDVPNVVLRGHFHSKLFTNLEDSYNI